MAVVKAKASVPMVGASPSKYTLVREVQPENAELPMEVTLSGMVTEVRAMQPRKA